MWSTPRLPAPRADDARPLVYLTPRGRPLTQADARALGRRPRRSSCSAAATKGIDQRVIEARGCRGNQRRRLRAVGRRTRGAGAARCLRAAAARRDGRGRQRRRGKLRRRPAGIPALHPPGRLAGAPRCRDVLLSGHHAAVAAWRRRRPNGSPATAAPTSGPPISARMLGRTPACGRIVTASAGP